MDFSSHGQAIYEEYMFGGQGFGDPISFVLCLRTENRLREQGKGLIGPSWNIYSGEEFITQIKNDLHELETSVTQEKREWLCDALRHQLALQEKLIANARARGCGSA